MGVYNPFAELPNSCVLCDSREKCDLHREYVGRSVGRHPHCLLVEVKAPHGRLIDADAIGYAGIEKAAYDSLLIVKEQNKLCEDLELLERANGRLDGVLRITSKLRFAPTVIPAEEG